VGSIQAVGNPENSTQTGDQPPLVPRHAGQIFVALLGECPPVITRHIGNQLDFMGREPRQVSVQDQVVGVLVVLGMADQVTDVMQERRGLEQITAGTR
jgi:hypothetical protein